MAAQGGNQAGPITTIPPFTNTQIFPSCANNCGKLYDANGACVPPAVAQAAGADAFTACFCSNANVSPFSTAVKGVCDEACPQAKDLSSIANWFRDICSVGSNTNTRNTRNTGASSTTNTASDSTGASSEDSNGDTGGGGDWISNHWQWVIFLVVIVVAIAAIWAGACIWRRRYLRKKDRQTSLGQKHSGSVSRPSWGPGMEASESGNAVPYDPNTDSNRDSTRDSNGVMLPASGMYSAVPVEEKPPKKEKKRWIVGSRT
ncbi:hypothetical protein FZEAL_3813 [Fusarium zealandicum]|uniref:Integral membrane protein n=1 Tax=Fusarium zealandicum TaxID=1053134 RepID=A0A8H4UMX4_9HYPO|nr:hypothetical protein FZEAL_3813 [Fusarium zealandicum]